VIACSGKDSSDNDIRAQKAKYIPISIYGIENNGQAHTQVDISMEGVVTKMNLNDELQLDPSLGYSTKFLDKLIIFYSIPKADLGIRQKEWVTGDILIPQNFCLPQPNDSFQSIGSNGDVLFQVVLNDDNNDRSFYLDVYNEQLGLPCTRIDIVNFSTLQVNIDGPINVKAYENLVLINYYNSSTNEGYLIVIDLIAKQVTHEYSFDSRIMTAFIIEDEIYIARPFNQYQIYNAFDFTFKREFILSEQVDQLGFSLIHPNTYQNKVATQIPMAMPSTFASIPAIINNENGNLLYRMDGGDLFRLDLEIKNVILENFEFAAINSFQRFVIDLESETIVFSYSLSDTLGLIVFADYSGNVLSYVSVPVNPLKIILH
jgi:hypothetical protein